MASESDANMENHTEAAVVAALDEYKRRVSRHNLVAVRRFVDYASNSPVPADLLEDLETAEDGGLQEIKDIRLDWCLYHLLFSDDAPSMIRRPDDIITYWDIFAEKTGLNGAAIMGTPEERIQRREDVLRGLQDGLQQVGGRAANLDIPADFAIMMKHADTLEGHGWASQKTFESCVFFKGFSGYDKAKASVYAGENLKGSPAFAWGCGTHPEYDEFKDAVAGIETGYVIEGACFLIYGRRMNHWEYNWSYYVNLGQSGPKAFGSLVEFLEWYQEINIADERAIENELAGLWE